MDGDLNFNTALLSENSERSQAEIKESLGVCGLQNLGNTCYMNASLQALSNCPQITEFFLQCFDSPDKRKYRNLSSCYHDFVVKLWNSQNAGYIAPLVLLRKIQFLFPVFSGFGQHDAQEFLRVFLNQLHDEMTLPSPTLTLSLEDGSNPQRHHPEQRSSKPPADHRPLACTCSSGTGLYGKSKRNKRNPTGTATIADTCPICQPSGYGSKPVEEPNKKSSSIVTDVFQGKLTSAVRCLSCKKLSTRKEIFLDISLSLQPVNTDGSPLSACDPLLVSGGTTGCFRPGASLLNLSHSTPALTGNERQSCRSTSSPSPAKHPNQMSGMTTHADRANANSKRAPTPTAVRAKSDSIPVYKSETGRKHSAVPVGGRQNRREPRQTFSSSVLAVSYSLPMMKRMLFHLISIISMLFNWFFKRMWDIKGWISLPKLTMEDCLSDYFSHAELTGENKYYCDGCKKLSDGLNQYSILSLPEVLCIHLKRFRSNYMDTSKVSSRVTFPLHGLELKPYLHHDCPDTVTTYNLMSIICHRGGYGGGHYVTYALNRYTQTWYEFDDDRVSEVSPEQVKQMTRDVYVLFYRKRDDWLVPLRNHAKTEVQQFLNSPNRLYRVYISRTWFVRFSTWAEPGPVNNAAYLCQHGRVAPQLCADWQETFFPIPKTLGQKLIDRFGGGPLIDNALPCPICQEAIQDRQKTECATFEQLIEQCKPRWKHYAIYAVSSTWLNAWKDFVLGNSWVAPGPIDNTVLIDYHTPKLYFGSSSMFTTSSQHPNSVTSSNQRLLRFKMDADYENLVAPCWEYLHSIYGGQPELCVREEIPEPPTVTSSELVESELANYEEVQQPIVVYEDDAAVSSYTDPPVDVVDQQIDKLSRSFHIQAVTTSESTVTNISNDPTFLHSAYQQNGIEHESMTTTTASHVDLQSLDSNTVVSSGDDGSHPLIPTVPGFHTFRSTPISQPALHNGLPSVDRLSCGKSMLPSEKLIPSDDTSRNACYSNGLPSLYASGDSFSSLGTATTLPLTSNSGDAMDCSSDCCNDDMTEECLLNDSQRQRAHMCKQHPQTYPNGNIGTESSCFCCGQEEGTGQVTTSTSYAVNGGTPQLRKRPHLLSNS